MLGMALLGGVGRKGKYRPSSFSCPSSVGRVVPVPSSQPCPSLPLPSQPSSPPLYHTAEGISRPNSPTLHLDQVRVPPSSSPKPRMRKSLSRKILDSFRETSLDRYQGGLKWSRGSRESLDREEGEGRRARRSVSVEQEDGRGQGARGRCRRMPSARGAFLCSKEGSSGWSETALPCRFSSLGCPAQFRRARPQPRLQHEAKCEWIGVTCHWGSPCPCTGLPLPLHALQEHLEESHGEGLARLEQEEGKSVRLSQVLPGHGESGWPDNSGCCSPNIVLISALGRMFLLFLRSTDRLREDYDIALAMLAPPQEAARYGYELRLYDEAGFAYRGPLLSVVVENKNFWAQGHHLHIPNLDVLGSFFETTVRIFQRE